MHAPRHIISFLDWNNLLTSHPYRSHESSKLDGPIVFPSPLQCLDSYFPLHALTPVRVITSAKHTSNHRRALATLVLE